MSAVQAADFVVFILSPERSPSACGVALFSNQLAACIGMHYQCAVFHYAQLTEARLYLQDLLRDVHGRTLHCVLWAVVDADHGIPHLGDWLAVIGQEGSTIKVVLSIIRLQGMEATTVARLVSGASLVITYDSEAHERCSATGVECIQMPCGPLFEPEAGELEGSPVACEPTLLHWGFLGPDKGIEILLDAVNHLPRTLDFKVVIRPSLHKPIPGRETSIAYMESLAARVRASNDQRIDFVVGFVENMQLRVLLRDAMWCVLPFTDGASNRRSSLFTSLAFGLPIITTDSRLTPGALRAVNPWVHLVPAGDAHSLSMAISWALTQKPGRSARQSVRRLFTSNFSWHVIGAQILSALQYVLQEHR